MRRVRFSEFRQNLEAHLDTVSESGVPLLVNRRSGKSVVILSLAEYGSMQETLHLLSDPANVEHLRRSIAQAEAGQFVEHKLIE